MKITYGKAIHQALYDELKINSDIILFGEDIQHNLYGYTEGLVESFGRERVIDIPLSESGIVGMACGAALCGLRPILDHIFTSAYNFLF